MPNLCGENEGEMSGLYGKKMNSCSESIFTFGLVVLVLSFLDNCCHGQSTSCSSDSRPDPRGICGERLARAHRNLCFLLRRDYPDVFIGKRSGSPSLGSRDSFQLKRFADPEMQERIYSIPLEVLADDDITEDSTWMKLIFALMGSALDDGRKRHTRAASPQLGSGGQQTGEAPGGKFNQMFRRFFEKASPVKRQTALNSNMVCECCYNQCRARQLGAYC